MFITPTRQRFPDWHLPPTFSWKPCDAYNLCSILKQQPLTSQQFWKRTVPLQLLFLRTCKRVPPLQWCQSPDPPPQWSLQVPWARLGGPASKTWHQRAIGHVGRALSGGQISCPLLGLVSVIWFGMFSNPHVVIIRHSPLSQTRSRRPDDSAALCDTAVELCKSCRPINIMFPT